MHQVLVALKTLRGLLHNTLGARSHFTEAPYRVEYATRLEDDLLSFTFTQSSEEVLRTRWDPIRSKSGSTCLSPRHATKKLGTA